MDLAEFGPYEVENSYATIDEMAAGFADSLTPASGPILLEAAYTVVGAHRMHYPTESLPSNSKERSQDLQAATLFVALFSDWVKAHRVDLDVIKEQKLRFSMTTWLLLDYCRRRDLLP